MENPIPKYEKVIYISHPYGGKKENEEETAKIILELYKEYPNYLFISPIHAFSFEYTYTDYQQGLNRCLWLLSVCDEIWVYGEYTTSKGCMGEIDFANKLNIPISIKDDIRK